MRRPRRNCLFLAWLLFLLAPSLPVAVAAEGKTRIDVMIVYTPAVTAFYHGHDGVLAHILATVAGSNAALANSEAPIYFHLVHAAEVDYVEAGSMSDDLSRLQSATDGYMDEVHAWRNQWGADLVSLFRRGPAGGTAGLAYLLSSMNGNPDWAFSVISDVSAMSDFVFAHETGHNLGANHAHGDPGGAGVVPYARGHRFYGQDSVQYRTVMAYLPGARIAHFSNPSVVYAGSPTGVPADLPNPADVALAFSATGPVVAGYRPEQTYPPQILRQPRDLTIVAGQPAILSATVNGLPPLGFEWFAGAAGDVSAPVPGASEAVLRTAALSEPGRYWLRVSRGEEVVESRAAAVAVAPAPPPPYPLTVEQPTVQFGYRIDQERWQTVIPTAGYWSAFHVRLWKVGEPGPLRVEITDGAGFLLFEHHLPESAVSEFSSWVSFPVNLFLAPGQPYRVRMQPAGLVSGSDYVVWGGSDGSHSHGPSSMEAGFAFAFRAYGTDAWTYHTWAAAEGLSGSEEEPGYAPVAGGLPNLLRYVLNADGPSGGGLPMAGAVMSIGGAEYLPVQFRQRKAMLDAVITIESSDDLQGWAPAEVADLVALPDADPETALIEARVPVDGEERMFLRLNATLPWPD